MSGRWFRFYDGALDDPKVQRLSGDLYKVWANLLCLANRHDGVLPKPSDIAFALRMTPTEFGPLLKELASVGLFDKTERGWEPHNWSVRQYRSDVSTERVKRFRQRRETVSETPSEQSRTDTEQREVAKAPRTGSRLPDDWQPSPEDRAFAEKHGKNPDTIAPSFRDYWHGVAGAKGRKADWSATWRNWIRREADATPKTNGYHKPADVAGVTVDRDGDDQWRARTRGWKPGKMWMTGDWGPPPDQPGTRVPAHLNEWKGAGA